jgi:beta-fructofuranosidase
MTGRRRFLKAAAAVGVSSFAGRADAAHSVLTAEKSRAEFGPPANATGSFSVEFTANLKTFEGEKTVLEIPGVLRVLLRQHDPSDRNRQNYPAFKMSDGSVPALEADVVLHSTEHPDWNHMTIGLPLAMLKNPAGEHSIILDFSGVRWTIYVDGELADNDFPFGYPEWAGRNTWHLDPEYIKTAALHFPASHPENRRVPTTLASPIQYWVPPGHNSWVGDVVTIFHEERYHVFYLFDRRHHQSKFGKGAHYFEHLSTTDFKTWTEHEAATPLEEQWECIGTGTPFVFRNRLHLSYGLHTGRIYPEAKTTWPVQWEYLRKNGRTGAFRRGTTPGVPAGATYSVSADGFSKFKKSGITFHPCQNPSVYVDPEGRLRMLANAGSRGIWESESVDGGWRCVNPDFPPGGDCTFFFRWGKFDYIIGGFTGLWSKPAGAPDSAYEDVVRKGLDFYDGSNVPSIGEIAGGRFLMAAWIPIRGWGGNLVIRELIQFPDGRIGSKWMTEIVPPTEPWTTLASRPRDRMTFRSDGRSFLLTFTVHPAETNRGRLGRFGVTFLAENDSQPSCELQVRLDNRRAQFGAGSSNGFAAPEKSLGEGGAPARAADYAIENLIGVDQPFTVRIIVKSGEKIGGSLIDAEIAGRRTMISYRPGLTVKRCEFRTEGITLESLQIARLKE